jgi:hypothetical protein
MAYNNLHSTTVHAVISQLIANECGWLPYLLLNDFSASAQLFDFFVTRLAVAQFIYQFLIVFLNLLIPCSHI